MVDDHTAQIDLSRLEFEERLELITKMLEAEGFTIEITPNEADMRSKGSAAPISMSVKNTLKSAW